MRDTRPSDYHLQLTLFCCCLHFSSLFIATVIFFFLLLTFAEVLLSMPRLKNGDRRKICKSYAQ